ncbi:hypothetical protein [Fodinicola feengrottensis]|nr:hypothetical protein [Fodinicola feengrottensis]
MQQSLRTWLKQVSDVAEVTSHEAAELDNDEATAKLHWQIAGHCSPPGT